VTKKYNNMNKNIILQITEKITNKMIEADKIWRNFKKTKQTIMPKKETKKIIEIFKKDVF
jgi:hypothetical protein